MTDEVIELPGMPERLESVGEVLTELAFHQNMAIRHTDEADKHLALSIEEYIAAGEHLIEVKARMEHGAWERWVKEEYARGLTTARTYQRLARNKEQVLEAHRQRVAGLSLRGALKMLAAPKEEGPKELEAPKTGGIKSQRFGRGAVELGLGLLANLHVLALYH